MGIQRCHHLQILITLYNGKETGQTFMDCFKGIINMLIGKKPNLERIIFCSDRGYWNISLVKYILLHWGDLTTGNVKRTFWYIFTYDQQRKKNDARKLLETKGPSTLYSTKTTVKKRNLIAYAYREMTENTFFQKKRKLQ